MAVIIMSIVFFYFMSPLPSVLAEIYQWQDKEGNLHFTDDPGKAPKEMRDKVEIVPMPSSSSTSGQQPQLQTEESEDVGPVDASNAEERKPFEEEVSKWQKKLEEDSATLEDLNRLINLTHTSWKRNELHRERARLESQIFEDKKMLNEILPNKGRDLNIERYW
jgi:hypothetical protein